MIKFYKNVDIKNADLLISFNSAGLSGNFASSLLINNNNFTDIGFYFSHYLSAYASISENGKLTHNGEMYYNQEKNLLIMNFFVGVQHYYKKKFFDELMAFHKNYSLGRIIIYGGISSFYQNDEELRKKNIDVYYLSNDVTFKTEEMKSFEKLVNIENKTKPLKELDYTAHAGSARNLVKYLDKNGIKYYYFMVYSYGIFDPSAGLVLYSKLSSWLGFPVEKYDIMKGINVGDLLRMIGDKLIYEDVWKAFIS
jgi:predicted ATP-grasp superfamily ATP-dependent carboligase